MLTKERSELISKRKLAVYIRREIWYNKTDITSVSWIGGMNNETDFGMDYDVITSAMYGRLRQKRYHRKVCAE